MNEARRKYKITVQAIFKKFFNINIWYMHLLLFLKFLLMMTDGLNKIGLTILDKIERPLRLHEDFLEMADYFPGGSLRLPIQKIELKDMDRLKEIALNFDKEIYVMEITDVSNTWHGRYDKDKSGNVPSSPKVCVGILDNTYKSSNIESLILLGFIEECKENKLGIFSFH